MIKIYVLKTKKTVTYYVYTQLTLIAVLLSVFFYKFSHSDLIPENSNKAMIIGLSILIILFFFSYCMVILQATLWYPSKRIE